MDEISMVGCDPHRLSITIGVVDVVGADRAVRSFSNDGDGVGEAVAWLDEFAEIGRVGIEGSAGHGQHLAMALVAAGYDVREVPPGRTAQRRRARRRPKTDRDDALAIAREVAGDPTLGPCRASQPVDPTRDKLAVVEGWRAELVDRRKRILTYADALLGNLPLRVLDEIGRTGKTLPRLRRAIARQSTDPVLGARLGQLEELLADHDALSERITELDVQLRRLVDATGTTLCDEIGISTVNAARLLVAVGDPHRFRSEASFARWCGTAAVAVSSGEGTGRPVRHRLDLGGNRQINAVVHLMSVVQGRCNPDARIYLDRKKSEGKTTKEARRAHKRHLANRIIRRMWADADRQRTRPLRQAA